MEFSFRDIVAIAISVVLIAIAAGAIAANLTTLRKTFLAGVACAMLAYAAALPLSALGQIFAPEWGAWASMFLVAPFAEETLRICFIWALMAPSPDQRGWIAFALGYALLECGLKFLDAIMVTANVGASDWFLNAFRLSAPILPLLLFVTLTLAGVVMRQRNVHPLAAFAVLFALHATHNASVIVSMDYVRTTPELLPHMGVRLGIFAVCIWGLLRQTRDVGPKPLRSEA